MTSDNLLDLQREAAKVEQRCLRTWRNQEVHVTRLDRFATGNRICPDTLRRFSWILLSHTMNRPWRKRWPPTGPGPWQIELTAGPIAGPLMAGDSNVEAMKAGDSSTEGAKAGDSDAPDAWDS